MKRILLFLLAIFTFSMALFADESGDEYDDGYVYEANGSGDQFLKFDFSAIIPLNFQGTSPKTGEATRQLKTGAAFDLGYYRFLNKWLAVGGEFTFTSNWSIGNKLLVTIPITPGIMFQPTAGDFEFPIYANIGIGYESWANIKYFPSLAVKTSAGVYYRITEQWSIGGNTSFMWIPQWFKDDPENGKSPDYNYNAYFLSVTVGGRFHF